MSAETSSLNVRRLHRLASGVLGGFGVLHLANHWFAPLGPDRHSAVQSLLRWLYRNPVTEPVLLLGVVTQVVTGVMLWYQTRPQPSCVQPRFCKWRRWSGMFLGFFLVAHTSAALVQRFVVGLDTNFYWAAGVLRWPLVLWFVPYYCLGVMSFFVHVGAACMPRRVNVWGFAGAISCVVILGGLAGWFSVFEIPAEYR